MSFLYSSAPGCREEHHPKGRGSFLFGAKSLHTQILPNYMLPQEEKPPATP